MDSKILKANLYMLCTRINGALNINVLKYLLPLWILPLVTVNIRVVFGAIIFWLVGLFIPQPKISIVNKLIMLALGAFLIYGYFAFVAIGVSKTTPISSSIFISLQPVWVFIISVVALKDHISWRKVLGIIIGLGGAIICIMTQQGSDVASDSKLGNIFCLMGSIFYAVYLVIEKQLISKGITTISLLKYTFTGAAITGTIVSMFTGIDSNLFHTSNLSPWLMFLFILIFPTIINYILTPLALKYLKTTVVSIYSYVSLVIICIVSLIAGQDHLSWFMAISILMIFSSVYLVEIAENKGK